MTSVPGSLLTSLLAEGSVDFSSGSVFLPVNPAAVFIDLFNNAWGTLAQALNREPCGAHPSSALSLCPLLRKRRSCGKETSRLSV